MICSQSHAPKNKIYTQIYILWVYDSDQLICEQLSRKWPIIFFHFLLWHNMLLKCDPISLCYCDFNSRKYNHMYSMYDWRIWTKLFDIGELATCMLICDCHWLIRDQLLCVWLWSITLSSICCGNNLDCLLFTIII